MPVPDSLRLKKESLQCEAAANIAEFLETYVPRHCYDFVLPDLLSFECKETLLGLRRISTWQALEVDFKAVGGCISEDWEDKPNLAYLDVPHQPQSIPLPPPPPTNEQRISSGLSLILATVAISVLLGSTLGWFYPVTSQHQAPTQDTTHPQK